VWHFWPLTYIFYYRVLFIYSLKMCIYSFTHLHKLFTSAKKLTVVYARWTPLSSNSAKRLFESRDKISVVCKSREQRDSETPRELDVFSSFTLSLQKGEKMRDPGNKVGPSFLRQHTLVLTKWEVKIAGHWPSLFACLWIETDLRSINTEKRTRPISSHVGQ